jgi:hypothetical protein
MAKVKEQSLEFMSESIGKFVCAGVQDEQGYTTYEFDGNIKKQLISLLPKNSISIIESDSLSAHQISNTAVSIGIAGSADKPQTYLRIYHEYSINREATLKLLQRAFR